MLDQRIRRTRDIVHNRLPGRVTGHGAVAVTQGTGARSPRARCPAAVARARWSARWALVSSRGASVAVASARSASSPVAPEGAAWSRPAAALCVSVEAISCALFPAVRDRSRTRVRMAPPAAWIRRRGRRDPPHRLGQETRVGRVGDGGRNHRRIGTYPAGAQQLGLGALASRVSFTPRPPRPRHSGWSASSTWSDAAPGVQTDAAQPPAGDRVGHLPAQATHSPAGSATSQNISRR
jgi:hypothetical protein